MLMRKTAVALCMVLIFVGAAVAQPIIKYEGIWEGQTNVINPSGEIVPSKVTLEITQGSEGNYILEMTYMGDKKARFTKCTAKGETFEVFDQFAQGDKVIHVHGKLQYKKDNTLGGTIEYQNRGAAGELVTFRTFKIWTQKRKP